MVSVERLVLQPPKKLGGKYMPQNTTPADGSFVLRFLAEFDSEDPLDQGRELIISYFLEDDTVAVFEKPKHNSGIRAGQFVSRGRHLVQGRPIEPSDLKLGSKITITGFNFVVKDADEYAKNMLAEMGL